MTKHVQAVSIFLTGILLAANAIGQTKRRTASDDADQKEVYAYVLTMDKVQKFGNVTKSLEDISKRRPEVKDESNAKNLDELTQKLQKYPEVVALLNKNGFAPREYGLCAMTLMQASMAVGFKKSGTYKEYPPEMLKLVSKANLDFVEQHWDAIQKAIKTDSSDQ